MDRWLEKDLKYCWHPFTQMKDCRATPPVLIEKAKGVKLFDSSGNFYYDTISSWWCNIHGHNHPKITAAIKKQLNSFEHVMFAGFTHRPAITLAEKLVSITPQKLTRVFYSDNGSTAVETALKMSFQYWQNIGKKEKTKFLSLDAGYHGDTVGAMSVGGVDQYNRVFKPLFFSTYKAPSPYCYRCPMGKQGNCCDIDCIEPFEKILKDKSNNIAAVILEPMVLAAAGMLIYPKEYLKKVAQLAEKYNVHLIVDEVATGFGRTGRMFACEHAGVEPDFMCLSKGIVSGYLPFAATLTTDEVYNGFYDDYEKAKTFYHGHTYTANPLGCSAAIASLEIFETEDTLEKIQKLIPVLQNGLEKMKELSIVGDVRQIGVIGAVELVKDKKTKKRFEAGKRIGLQVYKEGLKRNLILRPLSNVIYFFLPYCIKKKELEYVLDNTRDIIKNLDI